MAEATTTRPARTRGTKATPAAAKPATAKAAPVEETVEVANPKRVQLDLLVHPDGPTKSYARFVPEDGSGCVGTFYAPLGTTAVKVLVISE